MLQIYSHSNFQAFSTNLTTVTMLSVRPPELPYLVTESLYPVTNTFQSSTTPYFTIPPMFRDPLNIQQLKGRAPADLCLGALKTQNASALSLIRSFQKGPGRLGMRAACGLPYSMCCQHDEENPDRFEGPGLLGPSSSQPRPLQGSSLVSGFPSPRGHNRESSF